MKITCLCTCAFAVVALEVLSVPLEAQTKAMVRIAENGQSTGAAGTCTQKAALIPISLKGMPADTVVVSVQDASNVDVKPKEDLVVAVGSVSKTLAKDATKLEFGAPKAGDFVGHTITVTGPSNQLVCAVTLASADKDEDPARAAFRVGIGATFDFISGVQAKNIYADVTAFMPNLWFGHLGLDAGLYNGRSTTSADTAKNALRNVFALTAAPDTFTRIRQSHSIADVSSTEPLGNYVTPIWLVMDHVYLGFHFEGVRRTTIISKTISVTQADTTAGVVLTAAQAMDSAQRHDSLRVIGMRFVPGDSTRVERSSSYDEYFGPTILVSLERGGIEYRTKSVFGWVKSNGKVDNAYVLQFRITDRQNGFKLGGEIRKLPDKLPTSFLVYLSKDLAFSRMMDFLIGGDDKAKQ